MKAYLPTKLEDEMLKSGGDIRESFRISFNKAHEELVRNVPDPQFSGTTCTTLLLNGTKIVTSNSGDSRSIVVHKGGRATALSRDHKPSDADEKVRILAKGGRIEAFKDMETGEDMGPSRVWLKNEDVPGLAMSRSLGDYVAHSVGVVAEPEILEYELTPDDLYLVIASDGVWEFLSNEEVA